MLLNFSIVFICLILAGLFNSEMDTIKFTPRKAWFQSEFWLRNLWETSWLRKTFGFFTLDGWHLCKGLMIYFLLYPHAYLLSGNIFLSFFTAIPLMMITGAVFEISYEN